MSRTKTLIPAEIVVSRHDAGQGSLRSYTNGFLGSLLLTFLTYGLVEAHSKHSLFSHALIMVLIFCLAITQLFVQLIYFLHLGKESKPRWNLTVLLFAAMVVIILVGGSLWIMYNLNNRMTPSQLNNYLNSQDGF
jgi:cytochrome o ubiquinol oxidase operon protein cyoD